VAALSTDLAVSIGCTGDQVAQVYFGALFHDIGKQFVSNSILNKPNMLTKAEFNQIQTHSWKGYIHLHQFSLDNIILKIVLHHHEHWNGSGYPCRLKQNEIPLEARICTVVDVWDALVSRRCYRDALDRSQALDYIWKGSGILFDPEIVLSFIKLVEEKQMRKNSSDLRKAAEDFCQKTFAPSLTSGSIIWGQTGCISSPTPRSQAGNVD
jgi:HD-GYP domain-containing protein (c-di-GMP phosphodiesterase class II)